MIKPPNTKHKPTHNTFQYLLDPLIKLNIFLSLEVQSEGLQMLFKHKGKGVKKKNTRKERRGL